MIWKKKQFWGSLIAIALLIWCVKDIRPSEIKELSTRINLIYLIPSVICAFLFVITKALRWRIVVSQQKKIKMFRSITLHSAGQILNIVMPALTGQVGRMFLFSKNEGLKKTFIFSTIVLEILFDSISLIIFLLITSLAFAFPEDYRFLSYVIAIVTAVLIALLYVILHYQSAIENGCQKLLKKRWPGFYIGMRKFVRSFNKGMNLLRSSQHFFPTLGFSLFGWLVHTLVVYFLFLSFGLDLPFAAAASVMIINTLALMVPISPGNAGTFEVAVSSSLKAFSVSGTDAVLFALALHLLDLLPIMIFGYIFMHTEKVSIKDIQSGHEEDDIFDQITEDGSVIEDEEKV